MISKMKVLFIGSIYSNSFKKYLINQGLPISSAGQTFEIALLDGLNKYCDIKVISEFFVPTYPKFKKCYIDGELFQAGSSACESIVFFNIPFLKKISQFFSYLIKIWKYSKSADSIIVYELTSRQLLSAVIAGRSTKKYAIVPDLPEFMSENKNPFYLCAKKIDRFLINWALKRMDGFVLLSPHMKEKLDIGEKKWIVIEGVFCPKDIVEEQSKIDNKVLLYTGKIEKWFGLEDLLKAFSQIEGPEYQLWLCGPGDIEMINHYSINDSRIIYKGCLSHREVLLLQKQATILVNPRHSYDEFTLYSFPSKTMEYMASGTPTLMSKLKSLPDDYLPHLYLFEDESINGMSQTIKKCLDKEPSELLEFGKAAALFILSNKTSDMQAKKLVDYLL